MPLLPETVNRVNEIVATAQAEGRVPALAAAVVRDGDPVLFTGAGDLPRPDCEGHPVQGQGRPEPVTYPEPWQLPNTSQ